MDINLLHESHNTIAKRYELIDGENGVTVKLEQTKQGQDWACRVDRPGAKPEFRFYSIALSRPDLGLLVATRKVRQEFGITGTYKPVTEDTQS